MNVYKNALLTPVGRALMMQRLDLGWGGRQVAAFRPQAYFSRQVAIPAQAEAALRNCPAPSMADRPALPAVVAPE